jgi:hypothetical protein
MTDRIKQIRKNKALEQMRKTLEYSLSDADLRHILGNDCRIIEYADLDHFKDMDDLLPNEEDYVIILIESKPSSGHWTSITKSKGVITLMDSYGSKLTDELDFISRTMNRMLGQTKQELENLIKSVPDDHEVIYNKTRLQAENPSISTCGRWTAAWIQMFKLGYTLQEFLDIVEAQCKEHNISPDILVCKWIPLTR